MQEECIMLFIYYSFFAGTKKLVEPCKRENNIFKACLQD